MAVLTPRQETAQRLARELQSFGATVTNVMPLEEGKNLRFWCSDYEKKELLQQLKDAGHEVVFLGMQPQVDVKTYSMGLVNCFEILLPADRQPVQDDRGIIPRDIADRREKDREVEKMFEAIYGKRP
jgi:hypothetical protein